MRPDLERRRCHPAKPHENPVTFAVFDFLKSHSLTILCRKRSPAYMLKAGSQLRPLKLKNLAEKMS